MLGLKGTSGHGATSMVSSDCRDNLDKSQYWSPLHGCLPIALSFILSQHFPSLHRNLSLSLEKKQKKIHPFIPRLTTCEDTERRAERWRCPVIPLLKANFFFCFIQLPALEFGYFSFLHLIKCPIGRNNLPPDLSAKSEMTNKWMNPCIQRPLSEQLRSRYVSVSLPEGITSFSAQVKEELEETKISKNSLLRVLF